MATSATASGLGNDTAKKRKGPPSATEIFTDPIPVTGSATYNGDRVPIPAKKVYVSSSHQVSIPQFQRMKLTLREDCCGPRIDAACSRSDLDIISVLYAII